MGRLQGLIDAGQLEVSIVRGRLVLNLSQEVLFDTGKAELKPEGQKTLTEIATLLATLTDRSFQIEGHTDNVPIKNQKFPSNWELSNARAMAVVHLLIRSGVTPEQLSAAGFGEFHPVAPNDTDMGRQKNRRIEIVMLPNLNVIADVAFQGAP